MVLLGAPQIEGRSSLAPSSSDHFKGGFGGDGALGGVPFPLCRLPEAKTFGEGRLERALTTGPQKGDRAPSPDVRSYWPSAPLLGALRYFSGRASTAREARPVGPRPQDSSGGARRTLPEAAAAQPVPGNAGTLEGGAIQGPRRSAAFLPGLEATTLTTCSRTRNARLRR
ncbi:hypothetical protein NDU88_006927 [Pleurodeles waltl]|uniref:Uncharacterized protein n=1 Tax=Pleurodeles waltl TaxID=8319 RepID=A0AAV7WHR4_PLEWA|nr:hypothetical protein NDU88_006927 [Pleurodeles waltl]